MGLKGFFFFIIIGAVVCLFACKKNNDAPTATFTSKLNVINATADTVNFYLNGTRLNTNSNLYPAGSSGYFTVLFGSQNYQVKKVFNVASSTVQTLFSIPLTLDTTKYYSLFVGGETVGQAFPTEDTLKAETRTDTCLVRFVNASSDAGSLDFAVGDTLKFNNLAFSKASGFRPVGISGLKPIVLYQAGSATPIISGHYPLLAGKSYTFYAKGKAAGTGLSKLSVGVTVNYN